MLLQRFGAPQRPVAAPGHKRRGVQVVRCAASKPGSSPRRTTKKQRQKDNPLVVGLVTALTEGLRALGVGRKEYEELAAQDAVQRAPRSLRRGDVGGVMQRIKGDFNKNAYIITGIIDDVIYDPDCFFADPTVAFSGLALWKRNLQLLVPFLIEPSLKLRKITRVGKDEEGAELLEAEWELRTYLSLPWRPLIAILGRTEYTLNEDSNKVVSHVESWNVSGAQALAQMLKPSEKSVW